MVSIAGEILDDDLGVGKRLAQFSLQLVGGHGHSTQLLQDPSMKSKMLNKPYDRGPSDS